MNNWFNITDEELECSEEYIAKISCCEEELSLSITNAYRKKERENSWIRKNEYRKKKRQRFLSEKPDMSEDECFPLPCTSSMIYINSEKSTNGGCYCLNHVNHLYMTKRGYVEQFRGRVEWCAGGGIFGIEAKDHTIGKITNRRIRYEKVDVEDGNLLKYSTYKKKYGPKLYDVI